MQTSTKLCALAATVHGQMQPASIGSTAHDSGRLKPTVGVRRRSCWVDSPKVSHGWLRVGCAVSTPRGVPTEGGVPVATRTRHGRSCMAAPSGPATSSAPAAVSLTKRLRLPLALRRLLPFACAPVAQHGTNVSALASTSNTPRVEVFNASRDTSLSHAESFSGFYHAVYKLIFE
eukprot:1313118-Pleurochrysis_carterae.AAC.3